MHAYTPNPRPCGVCDEEIVAVKKVDGFAHLACPRCDFLFTVPVHLTYRRRSTS